MSHDTLGARNDSRHPLDGVASGAVVGCRDWHCTHWRMDGGLTTVLDVDDVRAQIRHAREARHVYVARMQSGTGLRYGAAVMSSEDGRLFRLVTLSESMVLTAGLVRRVAGQVIWAWASTPLIIDEPDPKLADYQPVGEL